MLTIVTSNRAKYSFLKNLDKIQFLRPQKDLLEIQGTDWDRILKVKCLSASEVVSGMYIVDDAGVTFDNYPNFPGTMTKFILQTIGLKGLEKFAERNSRLPCTMHCGIGFSIDHNYIKSFWGHCHGNLNFSIQYSDRVGFISKIFEPDKNMDYLSHRKIAFAKLKEFLEQNYEF